MNEILIELEKAYAIKNKQNKKQIIKGLIENRQKVNKLSEIYNILNSLIEKNLQDLIIFILDNYSFKITSNQVNKHN